ncbi:glycine N-acyltransferase-like [Branchiostoma floridae x Branchiostoma japonicum]
MASAVFSLSRVAFSEQGVPALRQVCREMGKQMPSPDNMTQMRTAFKTDRIPVNDSLPDPSLSIGRLGRHHAELVNKTWAWGGSPKGLEFIQYVLATFPSRCVYNKQGEPLAFTIMQPWGELGMMRSMAPRAGYASGVLHSLVNDTLEARDLPYGYIESGKEIAIRIFYQVWKWQWDPSGSCYWVFM